MGLLHFHTSRIDCEQLVELNTHTPIETHKPTNGSFDSYWQIHKVQETMMCNVVQILRQLQY